MRSVSYTVENVEFSVLCFRQEIINCLFILVFLKTWKSRKNHLMTPPSPPSFCDYQCTASRVSIYTPLLWII